MLHVKRVFKNLDFFLKKKIISIILPQKSTSPQPHISNLLGTFLDADYPWRGTKWEGKIIQLL